MTSRLPVSGNAALAAGALIQAALSIEFLLAGLSKAADPDFAAQFKSFVESSPGSRDGILAALMQSLIAPYITLAADLVKFTELGAGLVLFVSAIDVARRRFSGRFGEQHPYEPTVALLSSAAGVAIGGMSMMIYLIEGGTIPRVSAAFAFGSPIAIELLIVPLAMAIAWLQFARFQALTTRLTAGPTNLVGAASREGWPALQR